VAGLRARFDPSAKRGLGAHVTLLHWNGAAGALDPAALARTAAAAWATAPFDYWIARLARFPGTLYLAAEPTAPFTALRDRLAAALRMAEQQLHEPLVPHVSVVRKSADDDREAEAVLTAMLGRCAPISCTCHQIVLLENSSGRWRPVQEFVLNGGTDTPSPAAF
jgi:2'-5' RNA ligase